MSSAIITIIVAFGTAMASSVVTWIFSRRKHNLENINMATDTWQKIVEALRLQIDELLDEVSKAREENEKLREEVEKFSDELRKFKSIQNKIKRYENENKRLNATVITLTDELQHKQAISEK